jgi:hypothetical protein
VETVGAMIAADATVTAVATEEIVRLAALVDRVGRADQVGRVTGKPEADNRHLVKASKGRVALGPEVLETSIAGGIRIVTADATATTNQPLRRCHCPRSISPSFLMKRELIF